jgi:uncharacterized protein with FMN-binding domain
VKRSALWFSTTTAVVAALLSFHTSTSGASGGARGAAASGVVTTAGTTTVTGTAASTRFGDVQVRLTVRAGKVVTATAIAYPTGGRDGEISSYAIPVLQNEAVTAQSAQIDTVSGATYTSNGYVQSLQSALDQAHL